MHACTHAHTHLARAPSLAKFRASQRRSSAASSPVPPLFDMNAWTAAFEASLHAAWEVHAASSPPKHILVGSSSAA